jgi:hypothetical protein
MSVVVGVYIKQADRVFSFEYQVFAARFVLRKAENTALLFIRQPYIFYAPGRPEPAHYISIILPSILSFTSMMPTEFTFA